MSTVPVSPPILPAPPGASALSAAALALALLAGLALLFAAPVALAAEAPVLTVLAAGDLRGEIEPCGCSPEGQMGGLRRRLSYLEQRTAAPGPAPLLLDLGNNFAPPSPQGRLKMALINTLLPRFAPDAVLPGPHELAMGVEALRGGLAYVASNDERGGLFAPSRTVERAGLRIGLYGYLSPAGVYQGSQQHYRLRPVDEALLARIKARIAEQQHQRAILLFRGPDIELAQFLDSGLFHLIVTGNPSADELKQITARRVAGRTVPQVPTKGQGFLRIALDGAPAHPPGGPPVTVDWLTGRWPDHPEAAPAFKAYDDAVAARFTAFMARMSKQPRRKTYAGAAACAACHAPAHKVWQAGRHAGALKTLERVGKQFDPECLACHVVGLKRGGFIGAAFTPGLAGVQCENCHGPAAGHAANPQTKTGPPPGVQGAALSRPGEATCRTCHKGSHSPKFDFSAYWPKVAHGK